MVPPSSSSLHAASFTPFVAQRNVSINWAIPAAVVVSNSSLIGIWTPNLLLRSVATAAAINECPPSSKKSSWIPILSKPRTSCHFSIMALSTSFVGAT